MLTPFYLKCTLRVSASSWSELTARTVVLRVLLTAFLTNGEQPAQRASAKLLIMAATFANPSSALDDVIQTGYRAVPHVTMCVLCRAQCTAAPVCSYVDLLKRIGGARLGCRQFPCHSHALCPLRR